MEETKEPIKEEGAKPVERVMHTYESDLAFAMDTTDAAVVQELLQTARDQETTAAQNVVIQHQRGWYTTAGVILFVLALAASGYGIYYYKHLTVPVAPIVSVGVFPSTSPIVTSATDLTQAISTLTSDASTIPEGKPFLVPLVSDTTTLTPLSNEQTFTYLNIHASEPFSAALSLVRLGVMNTGSNVSPFLIFSTPTPETATKEFLIAEPKLLDMVKDALHIPPASDANEIGTGFTSTYMYNLPVRTLKSTDLDTKVETILLYYGYATDHTIVVATNPTVLKAIYDTIIRQR